MRAWLRTHTWHWFALALVLFVAAVLILHGVVQSVDGSVAVFVFLGACIRYVGLAVRDDSGRDAVLTRTLLGGIPTLMAGESRRRKRRPRS